jgi:hypothetical protein
MDRGATWLEHAVDASRGLPGYAVQIAQRVAVGAPFIKTRSMARSERVAKCNQLVRIEEELGSRATCGVR